MFFLQHIDGGTDRPKIINPVSKMYGVLFLVRINLLADFLETPENISDSMFDLLLVFTDHIFFFLVYHLLVDIE